jgi:Leucine-rich repeat (LRR) protein
MSAKINRPSSSIRGGLHDRESAEDNKKLALAGNSLLYPDEFESILSSMIDEEYIISVTGIKDISRIEYISLQIDTNFQSILDLTDLLPNLKHLVLDNSTVGSIRDLGVGLRGITSLSLSGCGLKDIDGIGVLTGLQELCLTDNYISDISPLTMHENLQVSFLSFLQRLNIILIYFFPFSFCRILI